MKKSTLMLLAGAVIAFFAYRFFTSKKNQDSNNTGNTLTDNTKPDPTPVFTSNNQALTVDIPKPQNIIVQGQTIAPERYVSYNGPNQQYMGVDLIRGDKIIISPGTTSLQYKVVAILGKPEYISKGLEIPESFVVI